MLDPTNLRQATGMVETGEISYKFPDAEQSYTGICLNISGSGILFTAERFIENGKAIEVSIVGPNAFTPSMTAYVEVIRSDEVGPGLYEVATEIKGIKEN